MWLFGDHIEYVALIVMMVLYIWRMSGLHYEYTLVHHDPEPSAISLDYQIEAK